MLVQQVVSSNVAVQSYAKNFALTHLEDGFAVQKRIWHRSIVSRICRVQSIVALKPDMPGWHLHIIETGVPTVSAFSKNWKNVVWHV